MKTPATSSLPPERLHWQAVLLGDPAAVTVESLQQDYFTEAVNDVIHTISVDMGMRLFELNGEDGILSDAINNGRFDILTAAESKGWKASFALVHWTLLTVIEVFEEGPEKTGQTDQGLKDIVSWLRVRGLITEEQVPDFCK